MLDFVIPEGFILDESTAKADFGRFAVFPFERGFGHTLGNSLRRILLSSISGCAVSGLKIEGVSHEFTSIFGVKEDVSEIILNLKKLCFSVVGEERSVLLLETSKTGAVSGKNIKLTSGVKLANPGQYLFTLDKPKKLRAEIEVTKGVGYVPVENRTESGDVGFIPIDADYSPVRKVAYFVENTRVKRITNYDKLILDITTDGSVSPRAALQKGAEILKKCAEVFMSPVASEKEAVGEEVVSLLKDVLRQSIEVLGLPTRILNSLRGKKILLIKDLTKYSDGEIETFPNFGPKSLSELKKALKVFSKKERTEVKLKEAAE